MTDVVDDAAVEALRRCPECLGPLPAQEGRGRPRKWCSDRCRQRARARRVLGWQSLGNDLAELPTDPLTHHRETVEAVAALLNGEPAAPAVDQLARLIIEQRNVAFRLRRLAPELLPMLQARTLEYAHVIDNALHDLFGQALEDSR